MSSSTAAPSPSIPGWSYQVVESAGSTNTLAGKMPAWTAVRARTQDAGRGRTPDRHWVSDEGGLWLSAVVPCPGSRTQWETLPLAAGWAVVNAVRALGVTGARLRWPNDVMVDRAKLAGLLVERYTAETAVVGIGLNLFNRPEVANPELAGHVTTLARFVRAGLTIDDVAGHVLRHVRNAHARLLASQFNTIADELNASWGGPRRVEITRTGASGASAYIFHGIDNRGRLRVTGNDSQLHVYDATQVALFREIEP